MKTILDYSLFRYVLPASMFSGWTILAWLQQSVIPSVEVVLGFVALLLVMSIFSKHQRVSMNLWNSQLGIITTLSKWTVEVTAIRQLGSVPIGIDLTHSAERVLEAMSLHYESNDGSFVRFFVSRPLRAGQTQVGFSVHRRGLRLLNGISKATKLSEKLLYDVEVLESAMRSAYPHVAVLPATLPQARSITSGGVAIIE